MLLAVDIGNTNVKPGLFQGRDLAAVWRLETDIHRTADEFGVLLLMLLGHKGFKAADVDGAIISSVVPPLTGVFEEVCRTYLRVDPLIVSGEVKTGMRVLIDNPREVGADRVANAVAAHRLYGGPVIVVAFGTATAFDAVSAEGDYIGGVIAPGVEMAAEALSQRTAQLPRIQLSFPKTVVGKNTVHAMQSGVLYGYLGLVEGIVTRMKREMGEGVRVVATGGLSPVISPQTSIIDHTEPDLTLHGLRIIHELNQSPK